MPKSYKLVLRRDGQYELRWTERKPGAARSNTRRVATGATSLPEAEAFRDRWMMEEARADREAQDAQARRTIGDIMDAYWREHLEPRATRNGKGVPTATTCQFGKARSWFGALSPRDVTPAVVRAYKASRPVSESTTKKELTHLNAALGWAVRHGILDLVERPFVDVGRDGPPREKYLDEADEEAFWTSAQERGGLVGLYVAIALDTAARYEAILELEWSRVDFEKGLIDFRVPGHVYTKKRRGVVPIADRLDPVLRSAWQARTGERLFPTDIRGSYTSWVRGTPWPWATPHVLRHTWATLAARSGVSLEQIALVLSDTIATVERHYRHHQPGWLRGAVNHRRTA